MRTLSTQLIHDLADTQAQDDSKDDLQQEYFRGLCSCPILVRCIAIPIGQDDKIRVSAGLGHGRDIFGIVAYH